MADSSTPPEDLVFETTDFEYAGEFLTRVYGTDIQLTGRKTGYAYRQTRTATDTFTLHSGTLTDEITLTVESFPELLIYRPHTTLDFRSEGAGHRYGSEEVFLANKAENSNPFTVQWRDGLVQAASLPFAQLARIAAPAETRHLAPIRFTDLRPVTPGAAQQLARTIDYLTEAMRDRPEAMREPLIAGAAGRLLAATVLATFPNTAVLEPGVQDRRDAHPATLKRAIAFIDDHAHYDISAADIAAAVHVTIRTLQYAFRRHLHTTPMGYLRRVRLRQAHQELLVTDPTTGVTVTQIAARWGFLHPGRFAVYYRRAYGRNPYWTLRVGGR